MLPKFLLLENVVNLVQKQHKPDFDIWLNQLQKIGYKTIWGIVDSNKFGLLQKRRRVFALSIYDPEDKLDWKQRSDLGIVLEDIWNNDEFKPSWIQEHNEVFDFKNEFEDESLLSHMKDTPSRVKMRDMGLDINPKYKGKISTITTKQDRWPNAGNIHFESKGRVDKNGIGYLDRRFITPRESYALMGFNNDLFCEANKAMRDICVSEVNARDKLYRQAGNSIAVNSLEMIFYYMTKLDKEIK